MNKPITIITHSGSFHADEVFAVATLLLSLKDKEAIEVVRTRDEKIIGSGDYVVDVGAAYDPLRQRFDHHQEGGAGKHPEDIPFAAFGLVWKTYGADVSGSGEISERLRRKLVLQIDALDNGVEIVESKHGVELYLVNEVVHSFAPTWKDSDSTDEAFLKAVAFAKNLLQREIKMESAAVEAANIVSEIYQSSKDKRIIELDRDYPWAEALSKYPEPLFVIYPQEDKYHAKAVRVKQSSFKTRAQFPSKWAGKRADELAKVSGVPDALFCHNKRFIAVAKSREGALALVRKALESGQTLQK